MLEKIKAVWKLGISELYFSLGVIIFCGVFGMVLMAVLVKFDATATRYVPLGSIMAVVLWLMFHVLFGIFSYGNLFNVALSLGCTRKDFIIGNSLADWFNMLLAGAAIVIVNRLERGLGSLVYPNLQYNGLTEKMPEFWIMIAVIILLPIVKMLLGALVLKFQTKAFWGIWVLWMAVFLGIPGLQSYAENHPDSLRAAFLQGMKEFMTHMSVSAWSAAIGIFMVIAVIISVLLLRKQAVTN